MAAENDFLNYVLDCMAGAGLVRPVRFFGGTGLTMDGVQFAFVSRSNRIFFVVDDTTRPLYQAAGMEPFSYTRKAERRLVERWYELPEDILLDPEELRRWMRDAAAIAARSRKPKAAKRTLPRKTTGRQPRK